MPATAPGIAPTQLNVPGRLTLDAVRFALGDALPDAGRKQPVELVARTNEPVAVWWADAPIVHDFEGVEHKPSIPMDWCHSDHELIGYLDGFTSRDGQLIATGQLTPLREGDRADTLIQQSRAGIPFEASITWLPLGLDYLPEGASTQLNGQTIEGPLMIVRRWTLKAVAICPHGADGSTSARFAAQGPMPELRSVPVQRLSTQTPEKTMPEKTPADPQKFDAQDKPDETKPVEPNTTPQTPADTDPTPTEGQRFMATFGREQGAIYFAEGLSFQDAQTKHIQWQSEQIKQLNTKVEQFAAQQSKAGTPVTFDAESIKPVNPYQGKTSDTAAAFAQRFAARHA